eukprot:13910433-Ditylum_brightwellii.AAC.1
MDVKRRKDPKSGEVQVISEMKHSCFWHACKGGYEGLIYVLLDEFPYDKAVADALDCGSFKLVMKLLSTCLEPVVRSVDPKT